MKTMVRSAFVLSAILVTLPCAEAQWPLGRDAIQLTKPEPAPTVTVNGRFQIFTSPHEKGDTFMLDTDTGKVWLLNKDKTSGEYSFKRIPVAEVDSATPEKSGKDKSNRKDTSSSKDN